MQKFVLLFCAIYLAGCGTPSPSTAPMDSTQPTIPTQATTRPLVIAHRGGAGLAPENTLASFRNGLSLNADFLEMDAHLTQDGVVVIVHDDTIDRTTDGAGRINEFAFAELQKFNAAAKYANGTTERQVIPTFAQVLNTVKPTQARIEVEIKVPTWGRDVGIE